MGDLSERLSFGRDCGFFGKHHGDIVPHRVHAPANGTLQARVVRQELHRLLANGTNEDRKQFLGNRHEGPPVV